MRFVDKSPILSVFCFLFLIPNISGQDDCTELFFTPAWHDCFMKRFQQNFVNPNQMNMNSQPFFPDPDHGVGFGIGSSSYTSSSSSSSTSGGTSSSVLSANGRTWTVQSDGLSVKTSMAGNTGHIKMFIGKPTSLDSNREDTQNKLDVNLGYGDGSTKMVSIQIDSPTKISELTISRRDDVLYIEGPM